ncbi:Fur-regulated basic protein FbpA [Aneurinibacillus sp. Ricciae_BoGa-3]
MQKYIDRLIQMGIFKIKGRQLYECSTKEIKQALYNALFNKRNKKSHI